jgi:DNA (cytosine-5)-methyltransferase 1
VNVQTTGPPRPKLLDLFCCQGGAGMGYHRAGFDVTGVDNAPQSRYPFLFVQADALEYVTEHWREYDVIHASPPCQALTTMSNRHRGAGGRADEHVNLIPQTRAALVAAGLPYVIENVPGARAHLNQPIALHGGMFGLGVDRLRLFETNWPAMSAPAPAVRNPIGVYGKAPDGRRLWTRSDGTEQRAAASVEQAAAAMGGLDWMDWRGLAECIPPHTPNSWGSSSSTFWRSPRDTRPRDAPDGLRSRLRRRGVPGPLAGR